MSIYDVNTVRPGNLIIKKLNYMTNTPYLIGFVSKTDFKLKTVVRYASCTNKVIFTTTHAILSVYAQRMSKLCGHCKKSFIPLQDCQCYCSKKCRKQVSKNKGSSINQPSLQVIEISDDNDDEENIDKKQVSNGNYIRM